MSKAPKKLKGRAAFDARGNAIWKFAGKGDGEIRTESVKALAEGLALEATSQESTPDPYNQATAQCQQKIRRRSLDDMRRLDEQMKREHEEFVRELRSGTSKPRTGAPAVARGMRLRLRFGGRELLVDERRPCIFIGRGADCEVVVKGPRVSRLHARIEANGNKFVLIDASTNGTFVQTAGGEVSRILRGSFRFSGHGMLGFGHRPRHGSPHTIGFSCEEL